MNSRNIILLMSLAQLVFGCCDTKLYEVTIVGLESRAFILDGNSPVDVDEQNPIDKEDLVIELKFTEQQSIASSEIGNNRDVKVLEAAVVPSCEDEFVDVNTIERIKVEIIDTTNNERIDITNQLIDRDTDEFISEYFPEVNGPEVNPSQRIFQIKLSDTSNIPNRVEYIIEAVLSDGRKISTTGGIINFN